MGSIIQLHKTLKITKVFAAPAYERMQYLDNGFFIGSYYDFDVGAEYVDLFAIRKGLYFLIKNLEMSDLAAGVIKGLAFDGKNFVCMRFLGGSAVFELRSRNWALLRTTALTGLGTAHWIVFDGKYFLMSVKIGKVHYIYMMDRDLKILRASSYSTGLIISDAFWDGMYLWRSFNNPAGLNTTLIQTLFRVPFMYDIKANILSGFMAGGATTDRGYYYFGDVTPIAD